LVSEVVYYVYWSAFAEAYSKLGTTIYLSVDGGVWT
jgi:hypothetical protein